MPFDGADFRRELTSGETRDLAMLRAGRHRIRYRWMWGKGTEVSPPRLWRHCAATALKAASCPSAGYRLAVQLPDGWSGVVEYNDAPSTTHADILALFDRAIAEVGA
jgi:hypothetical protein